jgi:hypothetical protein
VIARKLFPLSGIAFVALAVLEVVGIGGSTPASDASAAEVASFYDEHTLRQGIAAFVLAACVPFLVLFSVGLARALGSQEPERSSLWGQVLVAGAILAGAGVLLSASVHFALADGGDHRISPTALQALNSLDGNTWMAFIPGLGVMMLGAAGTLLSAGVHRWLGGTALVLGVVLFVPVAGFIAMLLSLVWIIVTSIAITHGGAGATGAAKRQAPLVGAAMVLLL